MKVLANQPDEVFRAGISLSVYLKLFAAHGLFCLATLSFYILKVHLRSTCTKPALRSWVTRSERSWRAVSAAIPYFSQRAD